MKKRGIVIAASMILSAAFSAVSFAGQWRQDERGLWWENDDGSRLASCWQWLDGNLDGSAQCFYLGADGYAAVNTEINGFQLNEHGAWVVNGMVQNRNISLSNTAENRQAKAAYKAFLEKQEQELLIRQRGYGTNWFFILDINQDGMDELLLWENAWGSFAPEVYAFRDGKVSLAMEGRRMDGMYYDQNNKALMFDLATHGIGSVWAVYFDGNQWVMDWASYKYGYWTPTDKDPLLLFEDFCQMMKRDYPDIYGSGETMDEEYRSYQSDWQEINAFHSRWGIYGGENTGSPVDAGHIEPAENNQANRSQILG